MSNIDTLNDILKGIEEVEIEPDTWSALGLLVDLKSRLDLLQPQSEAETRYKSVVSRAYHNASNRLIIKKNDFFKSILEQNELFFQAIREAKNKSN